jgi:hypothetical protein
VSSVTVFNEVARRRPDPVELLFQPFYFDLYEQQAPGEKPYLAMPIANFFAGRLFTMYIRFYIDQAQRHPDVPRLTPRQLELLDLIDEIAASPRFHLDWSSDRATAWLRTRILHGRTATKTIPTHHGTSCASVTSTATRVKRRNGGIPPRGLHDLHPPHSPAGEAHAVAVPHRPRG